MRTSTSKIAYALTIALSLSIAGSARAQNAAPQVDTTPPGIVIAPAIFPNPNVAAPLVATITLATNELTQVMLSIDDGSRVWRVLAESNFLTQHRVLVLGVRPNTTNTIRVTARDHAGNTTTWPSVLTFITPPLPASFPPLTTTVSFPTRMEPGVTMFQARYVTPGGPSGSSGAYIVMLDSAGQVVWYFQAAYDIGLVTLMRNGHLLFLAGGIVPGSTAVEMDILGNTVTQWVAANLIPTAPPGFVAVGADSFHHDIRELPASDVGNFLTISTEVRAYPNYPADEVNQSITSPSANVAGDVIVEFKRDGSIVRETRLLDILDPYRICYGSLATFFNPLYPGLATKDWGHTNAVLLDTRDDSYIISMRHQDAVVKIKRTTGQLVWICGSHDGWRAPWSSRLLTPIGAPFEWNSHQHDPEITSLGNLVMFDNGNYRAIPPAVPAASNTWYSRSVEFAIDPMAMTIEQKWSYGGPSQPFYSGFLGGAKPQYRTGNVLVTDGAKVLASTAARIVEVVHTNPAMIAFETTIQDPAALVNWTVYRSERIPGVYPQTWLAPQPH